MNSAEKIEKYEQKIQAMEAEIFAYRSELDVYKSELNTYHKRCEEYAQAYDQMKYQLIELLRNRFGEKSERFIDPENRQLTIFGKGQKFADAEAAGNAVVDTIEVPAHRRKKKQKTSKEVPVRIEIIPVSEQDRQCSCGACKTVIRYETK
jgi:transposase